MLKSEAHQLNFLSVLYNKIPEKHILKRINSAISLSFINELLKDSYCSNFGRPAKEPDNQFNKTEKFKEESILIPLKLFQKS